MMMAVVVVMVMVMGLSIEESYLLVYKHMVG